VRLDITAGLRAALDQMEAAERQRLETRRSVEQQRMALTETLLFAVGGLFVVAMLWMMRYSGQLVRLGQQEANHLRNAALLDPLTGMLNRRGLAAQLAKMDTRAADAANAAVLAFDLDGFKPVNDRYSHAAGDQVLKTMAQRLQQQLRNGDAIARIGGDEFVAVLPCVASHQEAVAIAQRVCTCLSFPIRLAEGAEVRVGASVGVATLHEDGNDMEGLLQAADKRMYVAKAALKRRDAAVAV
jgi:diguanylate cyclase (GGDEF)-like protein